MIHVPPVCYREQRGSYLVQKAKFRVLLFRVLTARVRVFFHQENITFFALENKSTTPN